MSKTVNGKRLVKAQKVSGGVATAKKVEKRTIINVRVGYGWMRVEEDVAKSGYEVFSDVFWKTIQCAFEGKHSAVENEKNMGEVHFSRLRASHGKIVVSSVLENIRNADILIFDVAASPAASVLIGKDSDEFDLQNIVEGMERNKETLLNANVLVEIGAAIALNKRIMLLCPEVWKDYIPSDLKVYLWTFYNWKGRGKKTERCFVDARGVQNGYIRMLKEALEEKKTRE